MRSREGIPRLSVFIAALISVIITIDACSPTAFRNSFIPSTIVVDTTGPHYLHNVSEIKYWDRISTADRATNFAWMDSTGTVHEMNEYYDKIVVLTFFTPNSIPSLNQLKSIDSCRMAGDTNVLWMGVGMKIGVNGKAVMLLDSFARQRGIRYQLLAGITDFGFTYGGIDVAPTTFVITRRRKIFGTFEGYINASNLLQAISEAEKK